MIESELRGLKRNELLEMLISLKKENEDLRNRLDAAEEQLRERRIKIEQAGSIAEAALQLNNVFESAERAAAQYLENLERMAEDVANQYLENIQRMSEDAKGMTSKVKKMPGVEDIA